MKRALAERANKTADANSSTSSVHSGRNPMSVHSSVKMKNSDLTNAGSDSRTDHLASTGERSRDHDPQSFPTRRSGPSSRSNSSQQLQPHQQRSSQQIQQPQPRGRKRKKEETSYPSSDEEDEEQASKAYFLSFQNKALASELYMLKHKIQKLELEEKEWRTTGVEIQKGIEQLEREWKNSLAIICGVLYSIGFLRQKQLQQQGEKEAYLIQSLPQPTNKQKSFSNILEKQEPLHSESPPLLLNSILRIVSEFDTTATTSQQHASNHSTMSVLSRKLDAVASNDTVLRSPKTEEMELRNLQDVLEVVNTMSKEAEMFIQDGLNKWIKVVGMPSLVKSKNTETNDHNDVTDSIEIEDVMNFSRIHQQMTRVQQNVEAHLQRIKELEKEKDDAYQAEKRVRRGLYRVAAGHLKIEDVMKNVENEDNGNPPIQNFDATTKPIPLNNETLPEVISSGSVLSSPKVEPSNLNKDDTVAKSLASTEMTQKTKELEIMCEFRNGRIKELVNEREVLQKRLNELIANPANGTHLSTSSISPEQIKQTDTYTDIVSKLATAERKIEVLEDTIKDIRTRWGITKGECDHAKKLLEELNEKHAKRWLSLTGDDIFANEAKNNEQTKVPGENGISSLGEINNTLQNSSNNVKKNNATLFSKEVTQLEHKLGQALEGSRQVEALRLALTEANKLNDCLQSQVSEWKSKYNSLSASKSASRSSSSHKVSSSSSSGNTGSSKSEAGIERLKLDFRKCRKELEAERQARENYKTKNERLQKERDSMMRTNSRLIKQSAEKEEMNTKSLSSILKLNNLSELHVQEIETLKQKLKAVEQVSLASRLASNAKVRFEEETKKEKKALEQEVDKLKKELNTVRSENDKTEARLNQSKSQLQSTTNMLDKIQRRCNELASESSSATEGKTKLMESLAIAKKETRDLRRANSAESSGRPRGSNGSSFTVDQLQTHLSVLKRRLACPVCNDREKACILLRCRHMFCKHCVEENIKNRSRKCPACGQRFDTKDVGDVWL